MNYGTEADVEDIEQELFGKIVRTLRTRNAGELQQHGVFGGGDRSAYPMLTKTFKRIMEKQVMLSPRTPKSRSKASPSPRFLGQDDVFGGRGSVPGHSSAGLAGQHGRVAGDMRPQSAPAKQPRSTILAKDSLRDPRPPMQIGNGVAIRPQASPFLKGTPEAPTKEEREQEGGLQAAIEKLRSKDADTRMEGATELSGVNFLPSAASTIANSGVLPVIAGMMRRAAAEGAGEVGDAFVMLSSIIFRAGSTKECRREAASALASVLAPPEDAAATPRDRKRSGAGGAESLRRPGSAVGDTSFGAKSAREGDDEHNRSGAGHDSGPQLNELNFEGGKIKRDAMLLGSLALPCHRVTDEEAVAFVEQGSMMWVYPAEGSRARPFEAYVQLVPEGDLFVGGVAQGVCVTGVVKGPSDRVRKEFRLAPAQRKGAFRVRAQPLGPGRPEGEPEGGGGGLVIDFRTTVSDMTVWLRGVRAVASRMQGGPSEGGGRMMAPEAPEGVLPERDGPFSYEGERDARGEPHGVGSATWQDFGRRYMGAWSSGDPDGLGLLVLGEGARYVGEWSEGAARGVGVLFMADGNKYEGGWEADAREGWGMEYQGRTLAYVGGFRGGSRHGDGISLKSARDGAGEEAVCCEYSEGELMREWPLGEEEWYEDTEIFKRADQVARAAREAAVDVAKMLKGMSQEGKGSRRDSQQGEGSQQGGG